MTDVLQAVWNVHITFDKLQTHISQGHHHYHHQKAQVSLSFKIQIMEHSFVKQEYQSMKYAITSLL